MFGRHRGLAREKEKAEDSLGAFRRIMAYFKPYAGVLIVVGVLLVLNSLLQVLAPQLMEVAVDQFIHRERVWRRVIQSAQRTKVMGTVKRSLVAAGSRLNRPHASAERLKRRHER